VSTYVSPYPRSLLNYPSILSPTRFLVFEGWVSKLGFKHLSGKHMRTLIEYITREWNPDFWMAFLLKTREWHAESKGYLLGIFHRMIRMFKVL